MIVEGNPAYIPDPEFKDKIDRALNMLKDKAGAGHALVAASVERITADEKSGADLYKSRIALARPTFDASLTWLASVLVHETKHIVLHRSKEKHFGLEAERQCNAVQLETLRQIGAPQHEIAYMLAQTGEHFDENGDGKFNRRDFDLRRH